MIALTQKTWRNFRKTILVSLGLLIFIVGLITFPLPLPIGLPLLVISSMILLRNSSWARLGFRHLKHWSKTSSPQFLYNFLRKLERMVYTHKTNIIKKVKKIRS